MRPVYHGQRCFSRAIVSNPDRNAGRDLQRPLLHDQRLRTWSRIVDDEKPAALPVAAIEGGHGWQWGYDLVPVWPKVLKWSIKLIVNPYIYVLWPAILRTGLVEIYERLLNASDRLVTPVDQQTECLTFMRPSGTLSRTAVLRLQIDGSGEIRNLMLIHPLPIDSTGGHVRARLMLICISA
jgi:hypothetical protein